MFIMGEIFYKKTALGYFNLNKIQLTDELKVLSFKVLS